MTVDHPRAGVVRIAVHGFTAGVAEQVRTAVQGARGVLLDLRGNSGGLVDEAAATAALFLDGGPVARTWSTASGANSPPHPAATPAPRWWCWWTAAP